MRQEWRDLGDSRRRGTGKLMYRKGTEGMIVRQQAAGRVRSCVGMEGMREKLGEGRRGVGVRP
jgi:hypothetical protein